MKRSAACVVNQSGSAARRLATAVSHAGQRDNKNTTEREAMRADLDVMTIEIQRNEYHQAYQAEKDLNVALREQVAAQRDDLSKAAELRRACQPIVRFLDYCRVNNHYADAPDDTRIALKFYGSGETCTLGDL